MTAPLIIVGAGIAGLAAALAFRQRGVAAVVLERRPGPSVEGAGIQIGPNGVAALERLGLRAAVEPFATLPYAIRVHDGVGGRLLTQLPLGPWIAERHGQPYWVVRRADLAQVLVDAAAVAGIDVRYGCDVAHVTATSADAVEVGLASGERFATHGVVAADGVWSRVRQAHFLITAATPTGRAAARALIPRHAVADELANAVSVWMAPDAHIVAYPIAGGAWLNVVLIAKAAALPDAWSTDLAAADAVLRAQSFAAPVRALLAAATDWRQWPLLAHTPLKSFAHGRIAVMGDAAHPMLPFLAQGAVMALEDATCLADAWVRCDGQVAAAFAAFSSERVGRANRIAAAAEQNGRIYHLAGALAWGRNAALRVAPPARLMARYDWIYGGPDR